MATKVQKMMIQPIKARVQLWLFEHKDLRIKGRIIEFKEGFQPVVVPSTGSFEAYRANNDRKSDFGGVTDWYQRQEEKSVKRLVEKHVAKAIEEYEKTMANLDNAESSGGNSKNAGGTVNVQGCSHKTFMNEKPHPFKGTEGVVGLRCWIEKAINMDRKLVEQAVQGKATRVSESNKRKWEDQQWTNHHQQQNRRQETAKAYVSTPTEGRGYARTYHGAIGARIPVARGNSLQNVTCFGYGEKGHYRDKCPRGRNTQNEGARGRAYLIRTEEPQQDPNVIAGTS
nr:small nuclear ribonucleoprotein E-like [Tanacetum cinerariifolium]